MAAANLTGENAQAARRDYDALVRQALAMVRAAAYPDEDWGAESACGGCGGCAQLDTRE